MKLNIQLFASGESQWFEDLPLQMKMTWESTAGTSAQNYSTVTVRIYGSRSSSTTTGRQWNGYVNIGGNVHNFSEIYTGKSTSVGTSWVLMAYYTDTIAHNNDGTKTVTISGGLGGPSGTSLSSKWAEGSFNATLDTIPRASVPTLSASSVQLGNSVTIYTNRASTDFTHGLVATIVDTAYVAQIASDVTTSYTWTPPVSLAQYLSGQTGTVQIMCNTYKNGTQIGNTQSVTLTVSIPSSVKPTASLTNPTEANATMQGLNWGVFVKGKSQLSYTVSGTGVYSSTITNYSSTTNGTNYSSSSVTTGVLNTVGSNTISATVTDNRGSVSDAVTKTYTVVDYAEPTIGTASIDRCDSSGTISADGTYLKYSFSGNISPVSNNNDHIFRIGYKLTTDSTYTYANVDITNYTINISDQILSGVTISASSSYDIVFEAVDSFTTTQVETELGTGFYLMHWNTAGTSMAIGKVSERTASEKVLDIALDTEISENLNIGGKITNVKSIEVSNTTPYIDFHHNNSSSDYTSRIIEYNSGTLTMENSLGVNGLITSTLNNNTLTIGSQNTGFCHYTNSANIPHWFNKDVKVQGDIYGGSGYNKKVAYEENVPKFTQLYSNTTGSTNVNIGQSTNNFNFYIIVWGIAYDEKRTDIMMPGFNTFDFTQFATTGYWCVDRFTISGNNISMARRNGAGWGNAEKMFKIIGVKF